MKALKGSAAIRVLLYSLLIITVISTAAMAFASVAMNELGFFTESEQEATAGVYKVISREKADEVFEKFSTYVSYPTAKYYDKQRIADFEAEHLDGIEGNLLYSIYTAEGVSLCSNYNGETTRFEETFIEYIPISSSESKILNVKVCLLKDFRDEDIFSSITPIIGGVYEGRYYVVALAALLSLVTVFLFIALMSVAGYRRVSAKRDAPEDSTEKSNEIYLRFFDKVPLDLMIALIFMFAQLLVFILESVFFEADVIYLAMGLTVAFIILVFLIRFCETVAVRFKARTLIKNNLIYIVFVFVFKILKSFWGFAKRFISKASSVKRVTLFAALFLFAATMLAILFAGDKGALAFLLLCAINVSVAALAIIVALNMKTLSEGGEKIVKGDLGYHIDTSHLIGVFKEQGENLNGISIGMSHAIDERMKSERLKTELITNVSHDLKTPLTSIINYIDLLSREKTENEKVTEYAGIISKHAERLKKLIGDLTEASKASSGAVPVTLVPTEINVLLTQVTGEYSERMNAKSLDTQLVLPEKELIVQADGALLWRVLDNVFGNVCKYSLKGTRVYVEASEDAESVSITVKNISEYPLNITGEELMERFVRADSSRSTEGSGLGLTIAKGLTEIQGGTLEIHIDGDLFKAIIRLKK